MAASTGEEKDPLTIAYAERSTQLYEARAALADAVQTLRDELAVRRAEAAAIREDHRALYEQAAEHAALIKRLRDRNAELEAELETLRAQLRSLQGMKVVRWTAFPRRILGRLRAGK